MTDFSSELKKRQEYTDKVISKYLPDEKGYEKLITEAMNYSVKAGGKRLRPIIMNEVFKSFAGADTLAKNRDIEPMMAAMEMIHTYSLVHDDLPAMDNDDMRRGMETTHKKFGHAVGILAGDGLLNFAFETALKTFDMSGTADSDEWNRRVIKALQYMFGKAGIYGMIGGQTRDVVTEGQGISEDEMYYIYENKTGALIEASAVSGAILGGCPEERLKDIEKMCSALGLAFQIRDDILDVIADEKVLGKNVGSDEKNGKTTYVSLHGIDKSKEKVAELTEIAIRISEKLPEHEFLTELIKELANRDH